MLKGIIIAVISLAIGVFLQVILIDTSPRLLCNEVLNQLFLILKSLILEYVVLVLLLLAVNKYIFKIKKMDNLISLVIFTVLYILFFAYMFNAYANKCG